MAGHRPADWKPRIEDAAQLCGNGRFMDDGAAPNRAAACVVRSPHAFARIAAVADDAARAMPGVLGVFTAADLKAAGAGTVSHPPALVGRGRAKLIVPPRPALAEDCVVHVGQPVAGLGMTQCL